MRRLFLLVRALMGFSAATILLLLVPVFFFNYGGRWLKTLAAILDIHQP